MSLKRCSTCNEKVTDLEEAECREELLLRGKFFCGKCKDAHYAEMLKNFKQRTGHDF